MQVATAPDRLPWTGDDEGDRLIAHDPRLPAVLWKSQTGMQELRTAYQRFERKIGSHAQEFVDQVLRTSVDARR